MARITIACGRCGAQAVTTSVAETMVRVARCENCPALATDPEEAPRG